MSFEPVYKHAGYIPMTSELTQDAPNLNDYIWNALDRVYRPWRYPDPNPMPQIVLFPLLVRLGRWLQRPTQEAE